MFIIILILLYADACQFSKFGNGMRFHNLTLLTSKTISSDPSFFSPIFLGIPTSTIVPMAIANFHFTRIFQSVFYGHFSKIFIHDSSFRQTMSPIRINANECFKHRIEDHTFYFNTSVTITNTLFEALQTNDKGGAVFASKCQVDFLNCLFTENHAPYGASVGFDNCRSTFSFTNFSHNYAEMSGGVIFTENSKISFQKCTIRDCHSENNAGGVFARESVLSFSKCIFFQNYAENDGGVLYLQNTKSEFSNCFFMNNVCAVSNSGAVLFASNSTIWFADCSMDQNLGGLANDQTKPVAVDTQTTQTVSFFDSCLSNTNAQNMNYAYFDDKTKFLPNCPRENPNIPEIQEEFHVYFEVNSAIKSKGFVFSILILIIAPIIIVISLPFLVLGSD